MSQESIWEKSLNGKASNSSLKSISIRRDFAYPLTRPHLRNYLNTHSVNDINLESIYDYFKENMFKDINGVYLPHLLFLIDYIPYEKIYKALDEIFQVISPNIGSLINLNYNYFQFLLLVMRRPGYYWSGKYSIKSGADYPTTMLKELYDVGLKHGLDVLYRDKNGQLMNYYYAAIAPFEDIEENYKYFLTPEGVSPNLLDLDDVLTVMEERFVEDTIYFKNPGRPKLYKEIDKLINFNLSDCYANKTSRLNSNILSKESKVYGEIKKYIKELR